MKSTAAVCLALTVWMVSGPAVASTPPAGEVTMFESPAGVAEQCVQVEPAPGAVLTVSDIAELPRLCQIDFYAEDVALCPKIWSTSPATIVHRAHGSGSDFEAQVCARGTHARDIAAEEMADYKMSMNGPDTSATFAPAALLYFHFARWFDAAVQVPPAVYRSMDRQIHLERVVAPGEALTADKESLAMLYAAWLRMAKAHRDPAAYSERTELYEPGYKVAYGVLLDERGRRYGPEMNGTRASGWGKGQNEDFQRTAPFLALRASQPLPAAIEQGLAQARRDPVMEQALNGVTPVQVAYWMRELVDITLLDFIFSQQDRIGNIDYLWRWLWWDQGMLRFSQRRPDNQAAGKLRITILNDNDAGVRSGYANYARRTGMLDGWHHIDPGLYQRVQSLAADFSDAGPVASAVLGNYRLSSREAKGIIKRGIEIADQLRARCESGALRIDLSLRNVLNPGGAEMEPVSCSVDR